MSQPALQRLPADCLLFPYNQLSSLKHLHTSFEIIFPRSGKAVAVVNEKEYVVYPGEILVIFPGVVHSYDEEVTGEGTMLVFSERLLSVSDSALLQMQPTQPLLRLDQLHPDVSYCMGRLAEMAVSGTTNEVLVQAYLAVIFMWLVPALGLQKTERPVTRDLLYRAMQYMSQNVTEPLDIRTTAKELGVNSYYLSHVLNSGLRMGFRAYLNALRIDKARRYLRMTSLTIEEIASACGFANLRTFDRVFIERCGCTPREFRKAMAELRQERMKKEEG